MSSFCQTCHNERRDDQAPTEQDINGKGHLNGQHTRVREINGSGQREHQDQTADERMAFEDLMIIFYLIHDSRAALERARVLKGRDFPGG